MKYKAVIVEDEQLNRHFLSKLITEFCPDLELAGSASGADDAVAMIQSLKPEIVFMDIELQTATGFEVLERVRPQFSFQVIFTTAFDHYAIKAIRCSAVDYILKPIGTEELQQAVARAIEAIQTKEQHANLELLLRNIRRPQGEDFSISLSTSEGMEFVPLNKIIRLEAKGPYTTFFMKDGLQLMVSKNLKEYEMMLTEHGFFRLHNSYIINLKEVKKMIRTDGGYAVMSDDAMIAISPKKKEEFMTLIGQRLV
ncbi:LytR/AlgR family response regulator transcription factor [Terrimonas ferruginea]|uniref:LytR/AlgR family response regulator transcription factor n=1 Tax=Terrimonas ferruginea TaxID=249 RepID=UPI0004169AC1|nr:LytTR family DNA-binding domain-containing protein [Terrimonas ferruginea]